jgi:hypothetical protein
MRNPFKKAAIDPLEARVERLERGQRDLQADWDLTYQKFAMMLKRWARREKAEAGEPAEKPVRDLVSRLRGA